MIEFQIAPNVLLAGQPEPEDWEALRQRGYRLIVNMRSDAERAAAQSAAARAADLDYVHLPLPAYELEAEHLAEFSDVIAQHQNKPMVIHCRTASRVALVWMLHRVVREGVRREAAEAELRAAGYDEDSMETFLFCAEDFFDRASELAEGERR
jgi:uncharacterized protein (TIGR01244 family)